MTRVKNLVCSELYGSPSVEETIVTGTDAFVGVWIIDVSFIPGTSSPSVARVVRDFPKGVLIYPIAMEKIRIRTTQKSTQRNIPALSVHNEV